MTLEQLKTKIDEIKQQLASETITNADELKTKYLGKKGLLNLKTI